MTPICALVLVAHSVAFPQPSSSTRIAGVDEPPELTGEPKAFTPPSDAEKQFWQLFDAFPKEAKALEQVKVGLTKLVQEHPEYSIGYFVRATFKRCSLKEQDTTAALEDINTAISTHSAQSSELPLAVYYSFRAKIRFDAKEYQKAMDDLEAAVGQDFDKADQIFHSRGTNPNVPASDTCASWSRSDLDLLVQKFPHDYRTLLFRGLFYKFLVPFDEESYGLAIREFQAAAKLNPRSPLPNFYIGDLLGAIFRKKFATDREREALRVESLSYFTKAIQLDAQFLPAYELRSIVYFDLRQYLQAIQDYDKMLELDPDHATAYADRGLAKAELGRYAAALFDYDEAIKRAPPNYSLLANRYRDRAEAYLKLGKDTKALFDLTKAIELQLRTQSLSLGLGQFRALYPEYDEVSDETLFRKLNKLFWPEYEYDAFTKKLSENKNESALIGFDELYEQRGDVYLRTGDFRKSASDFNRIFRAMPRFAINLDRWRLLGASSTGEGYYIDVKTVEFPKSGPARLWLKTLKKTKTDSVQSSTIQSYEIDCKSRRINLTSTVAYDSNDEVVKSSETGDGWQRIVPGSRGEQLYDGMCSGMR